MVRALHPENVIRERVAAVAEAISADYAGRELDVVCLSNSALTFTADLIRRIRVPTRLHVMAFVSYEQARASGEVRITLDVAEPLHDRHVLLVEGMVISGRTPLYLMNLLSVRQPASMALCAVGSKPLTLAVELPIRYQLFEFGSEWVAGYGIGKGSERGMTELVDISSGN